MQLCRWQSIESLRTYAHLGAENYAHWLSKSFSVSFEAGTVADMPLDSGPALAAIHDDETWGEDNNRQGQSRAREATTPQRRTRQRTDESLTPANARRRVVLVPSSRYPRHRCDEHGGAGWEAQIVSATGVSAVVRYLYARTAGGRPYEDTREPLHILQPID